MAQAYFGTPFTFTQPDGTDVRLMGWGNQFDAVFETPDGHTVALDPATGFYHYAELSNDKSQLLPTGPRVAGASAPATGPKHLRTTRQASQLRARAAHAADGVQRRWEIRRAQRRAAMAASAGARAATPPPAAVPSGDVTGLCILVEFPDVSGTITRQEVDDFCNQAGYTGFGNHGSVFDYFAKVSADRLHYRNVVTAYYTAKNDRDYYTDPKISSRQRARELVVEALTDLKDNGFDFSGLTADAWGFVYALNVFYAGACVNKWSQGLWPHSSALTSAFQATPTKQLHDYQITNMGQELTLRTFCHENGHMVCDFPDLYDTGNESAGVGNYCLMCNGGPDKNPVEVNAYLKNAAGWTTSLTTLQPSTTYTLPAGSNDFLIHRRSATEYFILENRQRSGRDAGLPDAGLAIWHVDEAGSNNDEQMTAAQHYELSLEQADGKFDLEHGANSGDTGDLFDAATVSPRFGAATVPDSRWWDGSDSALEITSVSASAPMVTVSTGKGSAFVVNDFGYVAGGWRTDMHPRYMADTTGDGRADIVGFGNGGVYVSRANADGTYGAPRLMVANFGYAAGGWRVDLHPRCMADTTGDGRADIVGFGSGGVYVARAGQDGAFADPQLVVADFGYASGWRVDRHPRVMADTTGDGRADIVGFGNDGVYVARAGQDGAFTAPQRVVADFGYASGWRVDRHPRVMADITGDRRAGIVGFGNGGVYVARANADGTFGPMQFVLANFGYGADAGGWRVDRHPRVMADITGDGCMDIVGFGNDGVYVARANGSGGFHPMQFVLANFGYGAAAGGWRVDRHPRLLADTTGNGRADIVGFGDTGVYVALANGSGGFDAPQLVLANYGYNAGGWRVEMHPRFAVDTTGDKRADLVGFGNDGVYIFRW
ncbi:M6 family metalloprotease domain-containing protein [Pseudorhodoferax sp.]|uniref:M6 family metalloprotease domain-containing protein n=1 Tax=Pseudorhodoferax sp. TaxID=1993553 RepID=UPI0039E579B0